MVVRANILHFVSIYVKSLILSNPCQPRHPLCTTAHTCTHMDKIGKKFVRGDAGLYPGAYLFKTLVNFSISLV